MKSLIAAILRLVMPVPALPEAAGYKVAYDGGSIPEKAGTPVYLYIEATQIRLIHKSEAMATIPPATVTETATAKIFTVVSARQSASLASVLGSQL
jgi:hypothetical protein